MVEAGVRGFSCIVLLLSGLLLAISLPMGLGEPKAFLHMDVSGSGSRRETVIQSFIMRILHRAYQCRRKESTIEQQCQIEVRATGRMRAAGSVAPTRNISLKSLHMM